LPAWSKIIFPKQKCNPALGIGNDIVCLTTPTAATKHLDLRFIQRVFTTKEQLAAIQSSRVLWCLWAAKESVFKIVHKASPTVIFAHTLYAVDEASLAALADGAISGPVMGRLNHGAKAYTLHWHLSTEYVHCVATGPGLEELQISHFIGTVADTAGLPNDLDKDEMASVHSAASLAVRVLAKARLRALFPQSRLQVIRAPLSDGQFSPPELFIDGHKADIDLSLSHDEEWLAVASAAKPPVLCP
jgi:phosphopantetheinyl transferase (holo-ACP synthase)